MKANREPDAIILLTGAGTAGKSKQ